MDHTHRLPPWFEGSGDGASELRATELAVLAACRDPEPVARLPVVCRTASVVVTKPRATRNRLQRQDALTDLGGLATPFPFQFPSHFAGACAGMSTSANADTNVPGYPVPGTR